MRRTSVLVLVVACLASVLVGTDRRIRAQDATPPAGPSHPHAVGITLTDLSNGIPTGAPDQGLHLLVIFGCVIALTGMADRSLAPVPVGGAGTQLLSGAGTPSPSPPTQPALGQLPAETRCPSRIVTMGNRRTGSLPSVRRRPYVWWTGAATAGPT